VNSAVDGGAVVERSVRGAEILQEILVTFAAHFRVHTRSKRIRNTEIIPGGTAYSYAQSPKWKVIRGTVGVFNY
jgi:hypothetical protein